MELSASMQEWLAKDLSQIVEGYAESIKPYTIMNRLNIAEILQTQVIYEF